MLNDIIRLNAVDIFRQVLDVLSLSFIFFYVYKVFKTIRSNLLLSRIIVVIAVYALAYLLNLQTLLWVLNNTILVLLLGTLIVFQPELRATITNKFFSSPRQRSRQDIKLPDLNKIKRSIEHLRKLKRGAIIILQNRVAIEGLILNKIHLGAELSTELLTSIFSHDTILHDGAVIIRENKIEYASCFLPIEYNAEMPPHFGSRHRAAIGIAQSSDAAVLVVSEQKGSVTLVHKKQFFYDITVEKACNYAKLILEDALESIELKNYFDIQESNEK